MRFLSTFAVFCCIFPPLVSPSVFPVADVREKD